MYPAYGRQGEGDKIAAVVERKGRAAVIAAEINLLVNAVGAGGVGCIIIGIMVDSLSY